MKDQDSVPEARPSLPARDVSAYPTLAAPNNAPYGFFLGGAVGQSPHGFTQVNAVQYWHSITIRLATGEASRRQHAYLWVSGPHPGNHLFRAPEGTGIVDDDGSIFSNRSARHQAVCSKNRVHFVSCAHERLFVSNQCRRIVANVEYSISSHRSITLPNRGHDRSANSRRLECGAAWPQSHETI